MHPDSSWSSVGLLWKKSLLNLIRIPTRAQISHQALTIHEVVLLGQDHAVVGLVQHLVLAPALDHTIEGALLLGALTAHHRLLLIGLRLDERCVVVADLQHHHRPDIGIPKTIRI
jgi:hypothetical protein